MPTLPTRRQALALGAALPALAACTTAPGTSIMDRATAKRQVADIERAFARTMADRDHAAFTRFLAAETVFFSGPTPLRGKAAVAAWWKRFYVEAAAPFSWRPDKVEVLDSGALAMSTGPVMDPAGKPFASFVSVWRLEAPGRWRIVFDIGCNCP